MEISEYRLNKLALRWSIVAAAAVALFWGVWYLVVGSVPATSEIAVWPIWDIPLPFAVSRWWDVAAAPVFVQIALRIYRLAARHIEASDASYVVMAVGFVIGLFFSLPFAVAGAIVFGLVLGFVFGLGAGGDEDGFAVITQVVPVFPALGLGAVLAFAVDTGFVISLVPGFAVTVAFVLASALSGALTFALVFGAAFCVRRLVALLSPARVWRWLAATQSKEEAVEPPPPDPRRVRVAELREEVASLEAKRLELATAEAELAAEDQQPYRSSPA